MVRENVTWNGIMVLAGNVFAWLYGNFVAELKLDGLISLVASFNEPSFHVIRR